MESTVQHYFVSNVDRTETYLTCPLCSIPWFHMLWGDICAALALLDKLGHPGALLQLSDPASPNTPSWRVLDEPQVKHSPEQLASKEVLLSPSAATCSFIQLSNYV